MTVTFPTEDDLAQVIAEAVSNHNDVDGVSWKGVARDVREALATDTPARDDGIIGAEKTQSIRILITFHDALIRGKTGLDEGCWDQLSEALEAAIATFRATQSQAPAAGDSYRDDIVEALGKALTGAGLGRSIGMTEFDKIVDAVVAIRPTPPSVPSQVDEGEEREKVAGKVAETLAQAQTLELAGSGRCMLGLTSSEWSTILAALRSHKRESNAEGWQPIETAPKDEDPIHVCDDRTAGGFHQVVSWEPDPKAPGYSWATSDGIGFHHSAFTHWRRLPQTPSELVAVSPAPQDREGGQ